MWASELRDGLKRNLSPMKTGKRKTDAMAKGYMTTLAAFLTVAVYAAFIEPDPMIGSTILMGLALIELAFGSHARLSLRLRKIEERLEMERG